MSRRKAVRSWLLTPDVPGAYARAARYAVNRFTPAMTNPHTPIRLRADVAEALAFHTPVVALESTLIAHGLPRPANLALARELEEIVRDQGAVPATVGVIRGEPVVGLSEDDVERLAT